MYIYGECLKIYDVQNFCGFSGTPSTTNKLNIENACGRMGYSVHSLLHLRYSEQKGQRHLASQQRNSAKKYVTNSTQTLQIIASA